jgi:hypothetical protein
LPEPAVRGQSRGNALLSSSSSADLRESDRARECDEPAGYLQGWVAEFLDEYPPQGACSVDAVGRALYGVVGGDRQAFDALLGRLRGHKRSARWTQENGRYIPRADNYLRNGTHSQAMPEPSMDPTPKPQRGSKTGGNIGAFQRFIAKGDPE